MTKPRRPNERNYRERRESHPGRHLLTTRAALIITLAVLVGLGGAGMLLLAHVTPALIVIGAVSMFGGALQLFDSLIE